MATSPFGDVLQCYVFVDAAPGRRIGLVQRGAAGWLITAIDRADWSGTQARKTVDDLNALRGIAPAVADRMLACAAVGWRCLRRWDDEAA